MDGGQSRPEAGAEECWPGSTEVTGASLDCCPHPPQNDATNTKTDWLFKPARGRWQHERRQKRFRNHLQDTRWRAQNTEFHQTRLHHRTWAHPSTGAFPVTPADTFKVALLWLRQPTKGVSAQIKAEMMGWCLRSSPGFHHFILPISRVTGAKLKCLLLGLPLNIWCKHLLTVIILGHVSTNFAYLETAK